MGEVFQVIGPPGTGKTTTMARWLANQAGIFGANSLMVCSYTKTAAKEIKNRILANHGVEVPADQIGTLHSICFKALGGPKLTFGKEKEFSEEYPELAITSSSSSASSVDNPFNDAKTDRRGGSLFGDDWIQEYELARAYCTPRDLWTDEVKGFARGWEEWKRRNGLMDFSDLLEVAYRDIDAAPGNPSVAVLDEAQDSPQIQTRLFLKWAKAARKSILAGDPDQTLYGWCGSIPDTMIKMELAENARSVLAQSYRVPGAVHRVSERWIRKSKNRIEREYLPRKDENGKIVEGHFEFLNSDFVAPAAVIDHAIENHVDHGQSVMFLASCSYMVDPIKNFLKNNYIPFANPWRETRGDWNPLRLGKDATTFRRLLAFLRPSRDFSGESDNAWTWGDIHLWGEWLVSDRMWVRGGKAWLAEKKGSDKLFDAVELMEYIRANEVDEFESLTFNTPEARREAIDWWLERISSGHKAVAEYIAGVVKRMDVDAMKKPLCTVGTVHSVKGGESDAVYLCPDISRQGSGNWSDMAEGRDSVLRTFFVGMTRAKQALYICDSDSGYSLRKNMESTFE